MSDRPDALLVVSFGGPEGPDDVMPFLENVTRGRGIPRERLEAVREHYMRFGGVSPINDEVRKLLAALEPHARELGLRLYWGNRNWHPMLEGTVRRMKDEGVRRALAFVTSAFGSYSGCRQYREDLERARAAAGEGAPRIDKLRLFFDHPGFLEPVIESTLAALDALPEELRAEARLVFTAHSIPTSAAAGSPYEAQLRASAEHVAREVARASDQKRAWELVWQSRSGPAQVPWLEPDVGDRIEGLAAEGARAVVLVPLGFTIDHVEVLWDLDVEARARAEASGILMSRARTVSQHPRYVGMIRELVEERIEGTERRALTVLGPSPDECRADCCPRPERPAGARR